MAGRSLQPVIQATGKKCHITILFFGIDREEMTNDRQTYYIIDGTCNVTVQFLIYTSDSLLVTNDQNLGKNYLKNNF